MAPVVRIKDDTWERLKAFAVPLEDSVDDVINRLIDRVTSGEDLRRADPVKAHISVAPQPSRDDRDQLPRGRSALRSRARKPKRPLTAEVLRANGVIKRGTRIGVLTPRLPAGAAEDDRRFTAKFSDNLRDVIWDYDGQEYSLSNLTMKLAAAPFNVRANKESENGFRIWGLLSDRHTSLEQLRKKLDGRA